MWTLLLVKCGSFFCCHYFNQTSSVTSNQSLTSAHRDFCPLLLAELSQLRKVGGTSGKYQLLQVSPQHFNRVKIWTLTGPIKSMNPLYLKPFLCSFAVMLWVVVLLHNPFRPSFNSLTDGRRFLSRICWYGWEFMLPWIIWSRPVPEAQKQPQTFTFPPPCFTVGRKLFSSFAVLAFLQTWRFWLWPNNYFGLICPENGLPEGLWFVQELSGKVETGSFVLFSEQRLPSSNPPMNAMAISFLSDGRRMHICPRRYQRVLQLCRGDVWVGLYLIEYFSGGSGW